MRVPDALFLQSRRAAVSVCVNDGRARSHRRASAAIERFTRHSAQTVSAAAQSRFHSVLVRTICLAAFRPDRD
jgi:hypothetical protein